MSGARTELEFKLRTPMGVQADAVQAALSGSGLTATPVGTKSRSDLYCDDDRRSLLRAGISLRVRSDANGSLVCAKSAISRVGALYARSETEAEWTSTASPQRASELPESVRDAVEPFVPRADLHPIVRLDVERELLALSRGDDTLGEIAIDRVTAEQNGRRTTFFEIEIESRGDLDACREAADRLLAALPAEIAVDDKLLHSLTLLALIPAPQQDADEPATLGEAVSRRLAALHHSMCAAESRVRSEGRPEDVHSLRVAIRRLRVVLAAFESMLPTPLTSAAKERLVSLHRRLGDLRATDVHLQDLPDALQRVPESLRSPAIEVERRLAARREEELDRVRAFLRSDERLDELVELARLCDLATYSQDAASQPASAARDAIRSAARRVERRVKAIGKQPPLDEAHRLRLATKRLRILGEEFADAAPAMKKRTRRRLLVALAAMGAWCDRADAVEQWTGMLTNLDGAQHAASTGALLGALCALANEDAEKAQRGARKAIHRLDRDWLWRSLGLEPSGD
jgi:CHAD domain-containing protein